MVAPALLAALVAGFDLASMGTAFIATHESTAVDAYRNAVAPRPSTTRSFSSSPDRRTHP